MAAERFRVLDSLRGICACVVALFHFRTDGYLTNSGLVQNGWLFVDFFFVLSGFVIASAYRDRLAGGFSGWRFMAVRLGRIYPLHLAVLAMMLAVEIAFSLFGSGGLSARMVFGDGRSLIDLSATAALFNSFGVTDGLAWNGPSWSIAAEIWAYAAFAVIMVTLPRVANQAFTVLALAALAILIMAAPGWLDSTYEFGWARCLFGFAIGVLLQSARPARSAQMRGGLATWAEIAVALGCILFVTLVGGGPATLLGPLLFAAAVLIFSYEAGALSRLLDRPLFLLLGTLSYSIYMLHCFVQGRFNDIVDLASRGLGGSIVVKHADAADVLTTTPLLADALTILMLFVLVGAAWLSYRWIELPGQRWSRRVFLTDRARAGRLHPRRPQREISEPLYFAPSARDRVEN